MATDDRFEKNNAKNQIYSDFLNDLTPHPVVKDVVRYVNENAINRSLRNLIKTNRGERLYQPNIGCDINKLLFEPMDSAVADLIGIAVTDTIKFYEPRVKLLKISVAPVEEENAYVIDIYYVIVNKKDPISLTVTLDRAR